MSLYFDASAFATLPLKDKGWPLVEQWLGSARDPGLSDLTWGEFVSAVGLRARTGTMTFEDATGLVAATEAWRGDWRWSCVDRTDIASATEFVAHFDLGLRLPDAIHIALAQRTGQTLVTTDHRQARAAVILGLAVINPLEGTQTA